MFGSLEQGQFVDISGTTLVKGNANPAAGQTGQAQGSLIGLLCSTSSTLVISVYDGNAAMIALGTAKKICKSMPVVSATPYPMPALFQFGLYVVFESGTGELTVFYN